MLESDMASRRLVPASAAERGRVRRRLPRASQRPDLRETEKPVVRGTFSSALAQSPFRLISRLSDSDRLARASARPDDRMAATPPTRLRVAVGLKQDMVEIDAYPDTTWESAKLEACVAAGDLDATTHRLLFRGREPAPEDTVGGLGVKPTAKLMLLETEASKRARARQQQEAQMEEMRRARAAEFSSSSRGGNQHAGETKTKTTTNGRNERNGPGRAVPLGARRARRARTRLSATWRRSRWPWWRPRRRRRARPGRALRRRKSAGRLCGSCEKAVIGRERRRDPRRRPNARREEGAGDQAAGLAETRGRREGEARRRADIAAQCRGASLCL